jgi:tyrosine-protein kinase Etk/Wzc
VPAGEITLFVDELVARPRTHFTVQANTRLGTIDGLRERLSVSEQGEDTGVVELRLEGHERTRIEHTLATIADIYLRQNTERRSAEARESLNFIESQMPELRQNVEQSEQKLANYQQTQETVDLTVETEKLLGQLVELDQKISELESRRAEAMQTYGVQHPVIEAIDAQLNTLRQEKSQLDQRARSLPEKQREMLSLKRELEVSTEIYTQMLSNAQELRVAKAGAVGNVRIVDEAAVADAPIAPRKGMILVLSAFLGGFGGCALVLGRRFFQRGVETPDELEQRTGLSVYAVVPHSAILRRGDRRFERGSRETAPLLVQEGAEDPATEALRSLRTSLHFGLQDPGRRVIAITSPGPQAGKSTVSVNLALLLAEIGQRVVLVDGDMRRGHMVRYIGKQADSAGLADVLAGTHPWRDVARPLAGSERASLILKGTTPPNPSELLLSERFGALMEELREAYDWVIVDAPPIMAVTDAAIIAHDASATFLVVRAARDETNEVNDAIRRLEHGGARTTGLILNDYGAKQVGRNYQTYYYRYDYRSQGESKA